MIHTEDKSNKLLLMYGMLQACNKLIQSVRHLFILMPILLSKWHSHLSEHREFFIFMCNMKWLVSTLITESSAGM
jgi:hypothetical protein